MRYGRYVADIFGKIDFRKNKRPPRAQSGKGNIAFCPVARESAVFYYAEIEAARAFKAVGKSLRGLQPCAEMHVVYAALREKNKNAVKRLILAQKIYRR